MPTMQSLLYFAATVTGWFYMAAFLAMPPMCLWLACVSAGAKHSGDTDKEKKLDDANKKMVGRAKYSLLIAFLCYFGRWAVMQVQP